VALWREYPYLMASVLLCALALLIIWRRPAQRRELVLSGLLGTPFGLFSFEFIGHYWRPKVVAFFICSPEDLIFSFAVGVIAWALATWLLRRRLSASYTARSIAMRYFALSLLGVGVGYAIKWTHPIGVMNATLVSVAAVGLLLAGLRRDLWPLALHGAAWFVSFYFGWLVLSAALWPHFMAQWDGEELLHLRVFGLPTYEFLWALGYGLVWPLFIGHILGVRLTCANSLVHFPSPCAHSSVD
jgi:hypothetical protein